MMSNESKPTILVVDDDALIRKAVGRVLRILGYTNLQASDGKEGLDVLDAHTDEIGLVILDLFMPVMSGGDALTHIRKRDPKLPVVVTSGHSAEDADLPELSDKYTEYLQKPFDPEDLAVCLAQMLESGE